MKYRKKPVEVEAFRYGYDDEPGWFLNSGMVKDIQNEYCIISTLEGDMKGNRGDYIIKGLRGELYPCKPDIFEKSYEKV